MKKLTRLLSGITLKQALFCVGLPLSLVLVAAFMLATPARPTGLVWLAAAIAVVWLTQCIGLAVAWISDCFRVESDGTKQ